LTVCVVGGVKLGFRYMAEVRRQATTSRRAVIVGAGICGVALARDLRQAADLGYRAVGFVDDDVQKQGQKIAGMRVLGSTDELKSVIDKHGITCVLVATSNISGRKLESAIAACKTSRVEFKILPSITDRMNQHIARDLRGIQLEDLLEREPVHTDLEAIRGSLHNRVVMVTGAGGSIGSEIVRKLANLQLGKIVLFERSENDLFKLGLEMSTYFPHARCVPVIGDILDVAMLKTVFAEHHPSSIFHAAAYKHVPMMEDNCFQAVTNNIFGTYNVALLAQHYDVEQFVMISSDKAVNPTNVMGVTKRVAELVVGSLIHYKTRYLSVRFGNVLGSNGSVVPIFQQQILKGGPVTVTHPEAERYFMTIPEAVDLVLQASTMGSGGEVFVLDMGKPVNIDRIARNLIRLSGLEPDRDIRITYTGLRPGEKMYEELKLSGEGIGSTSHPKIQVLQGSRADFSDVMAWIDELAAIVAGRNVAELVRVLQRIVPEYQPSDRVLAECRVDKLDVIAGYAKARATLVAGIASGAASA
jgi:FlaA1/EpsC-like NDP-sugar epimerase